LDISSIVAELEAQLDRVNSALTVLRGRNARPSTLSGKPDGRRRTLSAEARKKIALGMKKRWAERKKNITA
jgi:hypothetical protein